MSKGHDANNSSRADLRLWLDFHKSMHVIRHTEQRLATLFGDGEIPGFIHLSVGQEAAAVGLCAALARQDTIASTHRGHGHAIAKGMPLESFFLEILGKDEGACRGRSGSMHIADTSVGMLGANGIVCGGVSIAVGSALAHKVCGNGAIAVACFGDGAIAEGVLHEALNLASLWKLPVLFACDNNGWSEFSATREVVRADLQVLASAFGIPSRHLAGNDVVEVARVTRELVDAIREEGGPALIELRSRRARGHFEGDAQRYRMDDADELEDPLSLHEARLLQAGMGADDLSELIEAARNKVEQALLIARDGGSASVRDALADVYANATGGRFG